MIPAQSKGAAPAGSRPTGDRGGEPVTDDVFPGEAAQGGRPVLPVDAAVMDVEGVQVGMADTAMVDPDRQVIGA